MYRPDFFIHAIAAYTAPDVVIPALLQLYATGYGAGGRLGIGGTESVSTPTLLESIQHVFIRKVAVNSGGKHCLALSSEGEVYSWGEAEDGKLGHGNRRWGKMPGRNVGEFDNIS